jgi:hypothetical protein
MDTEQEEAHWRKALEKMGPETLRLNIMGTRRYCRQRAVLGRCLPLELKLLETMPRRRP